MIKRLAIVATAVLLLTGGAAQPAMAEGAGTHEMGQYVDLQPVGVPIIVHGRLVNYVFINVRLNLAGSANVSRLRDKEPYFRDALVRAAHRTPFTLANDYQHVDEAKLTASLMNEANAIVGPGSIRSITISSQASQRRVTPATAGL